jgi:hypothetical protein
MWLPQCLLVYPRPPIPWLAFETELCGVSSSHCRLLAHRLSSIRSGPRPLHFVPIAGRVLATRWHTAPASANRARCILQMKASKFVETIRGHTTANLMPFGPEPECGHEPVALSRQEVYVLRPLHLLSNLTMPRRVQKTSNVFPGTPSQRDYL